MSIFLGAVKKEYTLSEIERLANGKQVEIVIPSKFAETEYAVVKISKFNYAYFLMNNDTFKYVFTHTYNASTDRKTKKLPKGF